MAGGKIVRIAGEKIIQEYETLTYYQDNFTINAGGKIQLTTDDEMIFGEPEEPVSGNKYIIKGWWTDREDNPIRDAYVEDWVKFHIQTNIKKGEKITFKVLDYDGLLSNNELLLDGWYPGQEIIVDENGMAYIEWKLGMGTASFIQSEKWDHKIEYFVRCTYKNETVDLADKESTWLNVTLPPKKEKIVFVQASDEYELPEMYDAETGDIFYIAKKNAMYGNKVRGLNESISNPNKLNFLEKKGYELAVRRLKTGTMVRRDGIVSNTRRLYQYKISNIDGNFKDDIVMGVNFRGTKGINQLEAVSSIGISKYMKFAGQIMKVSGTLFDLAAIINAAANDELPAIPFMPPFITMEVDRIIEDLNEIIKKEWYNNMRKAIPGGLQTTKKFFREYIDEEYKMGYQLIELTTTGLDYLLKGEIQEININNPQKIDNFPITNIRDISEIGMDYNVSRNCGVVIQTVYDINKDIYDRNITTHYIHVLFLPELIEESK